MGYSIVVGEKNRNYAHITKLSIATIFPGDTTINNTNHRSVSGQPSLIKLDLMECFLIVSAV